MKEALAILILAVFALTSFYFVILPTLALTLHIWGTFLVVAFLGLVIASIFGGK